MATPESTTTPKSGSIKTVKELRAVHELYSMLVEEWRFLYAAYEGTRELIRLGYLRKHERETSENYDRRTQDAYGFNFTQSVVDIFNFYLCKKTVKREYPPKVDADPLFQLFQDDCNLYGDSLDEFFAEQSRLASIMGFVGIMVDKTSTKVESRQEQLDNQVYPYLTGYLPTTILDWKIEPNQYGRPTLTFLKLYQGEDQYLLWYPDYFELWEVPEPPEGEQLSDDMEAVLINQDDHPLGVIPFVFLINKKWKKPPLGKSDISDIARIDCSIIRNCSQGEEIIDYSAFPMMRKPNLEARPDAGSAGGAQEDTTGPTAVLGFDPDNPESKPDWMESEAADPLNAIKEWIINKIEQIYRAANIGGMAATEIQTQAKSGTALQAEFQLLNSSLVRKAINLEKAEKRIQKFWYMWEYETESNDLMEKTLVERERTYDVEDLATDLENILTSKSIVMSKTFDEQMQKKVARKMLPSYTDSQMKDIDEEIEAASEKKPEPGEENNQNFKPFGDQEDEVPPGETDEEEE